MNGDIPETAITAASLFPLDSLALKMAKEQIMRGENPPMNTTATLVAALERIAAAAPHIDAAARASERETIRQQLLDVVTANVREGNDHVLGALLEAIRELSADDLGLDGASNDR